ncbi:hypothetical protein BDZ91DRAFT_781293 [Kalaharituber pfeilii]|nr:hypothetical protein BDZ91DRAFT_781293 [Kalaharituber pfeilii]
MTVLRASHFLHTTSGFRTLANKYHVLITHTIDERPSATGPPNDRSGPLMSGRLRRLAPNNTRNCLGIAHYKLHMGTVATWGIYCSWGTLKIGVLCLGTKIQQAHFCWEIIEELVGIRGEIEIRALILAGKNHGNLLAVERWKDKRSRGRKI